MEVKTMDKEKKKKQTKDWEEGYKEGKQGRVYGDPTAEIKNE